MRSLLILLSVALLIPTALPLAAQEQGSDEGPPLTALVTLPELLERATLAEQAGDFRQAILDYSLFLIFNPTVGQAWHGRGFSHMQNGDFFRALLDLERALGYSDRPEEQADILIDRAEVFRRQNRISDALEALDRALMVWPEQVYGRMLRARLREIEGRPAAALNDWDALLRMMPGEAGILLERGMFHARRGDGDAAVLDFNDVIALEPENALARIERAALLAAQGDYTAALADVEEAIALDAGNVALILFRASLLQEAGEVQASASGYLQWLYKIRRETLREADLLEQGEVTVNMVPGRSYIFSFEGRAGDTLVAGAANLVAGEVDPLIVVTDAAGNALIADDDGGSAMDARIAGYVLPGDGGYRLVVGHAGGSAVGPLRVTLELEPA